MKITLTLNLIKFLHINDTNNDSAVNFLLNKIILNSFFYFQFIL